MTTHTPKPLAWCTALRCEQLSMEVFTGVNGILLIPSHEAGRVGSNRPSIGNFGVWKECSVASLRRKKKKMRSQWMRSMRSRHSPQSFLGASNSVQQQNALRGSAGSAGLYVSESFLSSHTQQVRSQDRHGTPSSQHPQSAVRQLLITSFPTSPCRWVRRRSWLKSGKVTITGYPELRNRRTESNANPPSVRLTSHIQRVLN